MGDSNRVRMEAGRAAVVDRLNQAECAEQTVLERKKLSWGLCPQTPGILSLYRQDSWESGRKCALAPAESRLLGRASRCVPAELYPPPR